MNSFKILPVFRKNHHISNKTSLKKCSTKQSIYLALLDNKTYKKYTKKRSKTFPIITGFLGYENRSSGKKLAKTQRTHL